MAEYLIAFNDEWVPQHTLEELTEKSDRGEAVLEEMRAAGVFVYANGGIDSSTALFNVESVEEEPVFTDGPFVETEEHLGGFSIVDVSDLESALEWAKKPAVACRRPQEVKPFVDPPAVETAAEKE